MHTPLKVEDHKLVISSIQKTIESESESFKNQATTVTTDKYTVTVRGKYPNNTIVHGRDKSQLSMITSSQAHDGTLPSVDNTEAEAHIIQAKTGQPDNGTKLKKRHR